MKAFVFTFTGLIFIVDADCDLWEALVEDEETVDSLKITVGRDCIFCEVPAEVVETVLSLMEYIPSVKPGIAALLNNRKKFAITRCLDTTFYIVLIVQ